jgi:two-component system, chemotaxis family, sensor histidine kinase and response regulator PixL
MSLNPDIRDQAYQFFIEEAQELLQVLETGLLDLRQDHSVPKVHELMRAAHSIKGGAASVELSAIGLLAHRLEDFFKALYSDDIDFDAELESLLLQGYDCLSHPLLEQVAAGAFDEEAALLKAEPVFAALEIRLAEALQNADNYIPSSNDLGVDIVASIFEVDVVQALEHLQSVVAAPDNYDPAAELAGTLEMFAGFAELFNLSGFSDLVQTAQTALELNPQAVLTIIQITVVDCTVATEQVLAGDREQGGAASLALMELAQGNLGGTEQIALDQDQLWATAPLAEDIFGAMIQEYSELEFSTSEASNEVDPDNLWSTIPEQENLIEDIFGTILDDSDALELNQEPELVAETNLDSDDLSQLFDMVTDESVAETVATDDVFAFHEIPSDSSNLWSTIPDESNALKLNSASETATDGLDDISQLFDMIAEETVAETDLPQLELPELPSQIATPASELVVKTTAAASKLSVRVDLDRLERMNNVVGELTINRNSLALQNEQLQENVGELEQKFVRFRGITRKLREISDQMLLEARSRDPQLLKPQEHQTLGHHSAIAEFDTLEMDSYNLLHSSLQEVLEEMIQLEESVEDITIFAQQSDRTISSQSKMLGQLRDELMWVRMLPLDQILQRFPRTLRDLSSKYQKPVELKLTGTGVLVDKAVLEKLSDPLLHLLRNGFDHGIEDPQVRTQQGKAATGLIEIQAYYQGNQTVIEVKDDGQGLNLASIAQKGIEKGLISPQEAAIASPERLFELIFEPGFSTASQVSEISGRGVGMNIVRSQVETLKGKIRVTSTPGKGSTFTLRLPLTLTIAKLLVCSLGPTNFAIPADSIEEIMIPTPEQIQLTNGERFLALNGKLIPIYVLREILAYNCPIPDADSNSKTFKTIPAPDDWEAPLLLVRRGEQLYALEVVSLLREQELVIKPYGQAIAAPVYSYGCTILSDGSLIPAFDGSALIGMILGETQQTETNNSQSWLSTSEQLAAGKQEIRGEQQRTSVKTIMVVDDSTALRRTMALTLEKEGYRVVQKKDGKEALDGFKQHPEIDLIICDVEMPVMNGFEFLGMRRRDSALAKVPTFMLTSRSGEKHRNLAKQLGSDGYFTKPYVEQDFIQEIKNILDSQNPLEPETQTAIAIKIKTILIIDDSSALRRTLALSLEQKGYRVLQGRDGIEGLEQLRSNCQTNLVICDLEMPNLNGFEFLTLCRQETQLNQIPVVMLTSRGSDKHRALAASLGAVGFFTKPYIEESFIAEIEQYICL